MSSLLRPFKGNPSSRRRSSNRSLGESSPTQASRTCRRSSKCLSTRLPPTPADTTKSTRRTSATHFFIDKSMQDLYEKIQNHSPQIVFNKYNHELVREKPYRLAWAGQTRRTCHGSAPRPTKRKSQLQYDNFRKEQNHRICAFIRMLHGAELLSYTCNVMRQSSAVYKKLPSTFAQTLPWHPWDQNDQQSKIHQNSNTRPFDHIYPSIWLSSMVPRQKSYIAQISFVIHIKIDQYHSLRSVPRATSQSHESKNKQILQPLSKSYPSIYMT